MTCRYSTTAPELPAFFTSIPVAQLDSLCHNEFVAQPMEKAMPPPISKRTIKAASLLKVPHPQHPERCYTMAEAAKKVGINRSTVYRYVKQQQEKV